MSNGEGIGIYNIIYYYCYYHYYYLLLGRFDAQIVVWNDSKQRRKPLKLLGKITGLDNRDRIG